MISLITGRYCSMILRVLQLAASIIRPSIYLYEPISGQSITEQTAVVVVPQPTDGDVTCVPRPSELNTG